MEERQTASGVCGPAERRNEGENGLGNELRLDRFLADMGKGTRSEIRDAVRKGCVSVNGETERRPEQKIRPGADLVELDGRPVTYVRTEYYMLNKPAGVITATRDGRRRTVLDLIGEKQRKDLVPAGRLDIDTEGLLLITNDGALIHRLLSPKKHVDKVYFARCQGRVPEDAVKTFAEGIVLPDGLHCLPAVLEIAEYGDGCTDVRLTVREGKFHQVKRMMEAVGCPVVYLKRLSMGPLVLDPALAPGEYRTLTENELELLRTL